jgi:hypothetical protein
MINGSWTLERAAQFANRISQAKTVQQKVELAYQLAYSRKPTDLEIKSAVAFLAEQPGTQGLVDFCHVLLNSNEFVYVD